MEKRGEVHELAAPFNNLNIKINFNSKSKLSDKSSPSVHFFSSQFAILNGGLPIQKSKPRTLVNLCLGVIGKHFEDIIPDLDDLAVSFPADVKMAMTAIARRRKLLTDDVVISLADSSWEILDISGSDITDDGLAKVAETCRSLRAVDISRCNKITVLGVSELLQHCHSLETLRFGGCPTSNFTARACLSVLKPMLNVLVEDCWEELDTVDISHGAQSLRWLVWPKIDNDSLEKLSAECPRITVNPKPSPLSFRDNVPKEASSSITLDDIIVKDIDPKTWSVCGLVQKVLSSSTSNPNDLPIAEKFRLAFVERDTRLAPKRAKNARQHQCRLAREWAMANTDAKAVVLASQASRSLHNRNL